MKRKNIWNKQAAFAFMMVLLITAAYTIPVWADAPYRTYTINSYKTDILQTQAAYLPYATLTRFGEEAFSNPSDMCVSDDGSVYVADTQNSRIVVGDLQGNLIKIIGEGILQTPRGVFVTAENHIYVADRDAKAIFEFDEAGQLLNQYGKPTSPLYGESLDFLPIKIVVNDAGIMFVVCESNTNGIVEISPSDGGTFLGYFGTNQADVSLQTIIYRAILTDAQRAKMVSNIPSTPDNLCIDGDGLIYTVTRGESLDTLKRLNIAGKNVVEPDTYDDIPAAVTAGNHDNVFMVSQQGFIYEFNELGELLFIFGGSDDGTQRVGLCTLVGAISVDQQNRIYVLDTDKCQIQVYRPTEFADLLHEALTLYAKGRYTESKEPLSEVLKMNSMFDYANKAMGRAYFQEDNYEMAEQYAILSKDYSGYSEAAWELRNLWLKKYLIPSLGIIVLLWLLRKIILKPFHKLWQRLSAYPVIDNLKFAWTFMRHPLNGCYSIAREGRASLFTANILVLVFTVEFIIHKYLCGFLQKTVAEGQYELITDIGTIVLVLAALTVCNYLVCTINEGEGNIKKIYCSFAYCLTPYISMIPVIFILSHVLTRNEQFLITFVYLLAYGWMAVLFVLAVKEINNFTAKETIKILLLTLFTILILALLIFIIYILWSQVFEFMVAIVGEVVYRLGS